MLNFAYFCFHEIKKLNTEIMKKQVQYVVVMIFISVVFVSCAERQMVDECLDGKTYGFLWGLIHGIIAPFGLVGMLFKEDITVFATNNNGFWYAFGFFLFRQWRMGNFS